MLAILGFAAAVGFGATVLSLAISFEPSPAITVDDSRFDSFEYAAIWD